MLSIILESTSLSMTKPERRRQNVKQPQYVEICPHFSSVLGNELFRSYWEIKKNLFCQSKRCTSLSYIFFGSQISFESHANLLKEDRVFDEVEVQNYNAQHCSKRVSTGSDEVVYNR